MRAYAAMTTLIRDKLQVASTVDYPVAEVDRAIEEGLKEWGTRIPHVVPVTFKVESRFGTASTTSADNLVDTRKGQFLSTDSADEKRVYNATEHNWSVVLSFSSTAQLGISSNIFTVNDEYRIYNKRCWNKRQIWIADVTENPHIDSVEYPVGEERKWVIVEPGVLEVKAANIRDSDTTLDHLPDVDVLVRFKMPHVLSQLTDWAGKFAATAASGATSLSGSSLQSSGTIEVGEEFYVENHRTLYRVTAETAITSNTAAISFYPGLESAVSSTAWTINFVQSTLRPNDEQYFAELVAGRLIVGRAPEFISNLPVGGLGALTFVMQSAQQRIDRALAYLKSNTPYVRTFNHPED